MSKTARRKRRPFTASDAIEMRDSDLNREAEMYMSYHQHEERLMPYEALRGLLDSQ